MKRFIQYLLNRCGYSIRRLNSDYKFLSQYRFNTVLDVGANTGQFAAAIRTALPAATIHSFEPAREAYTVLERRFLHDQRFFAHNVALGDCVTSLVLHVSRSDPSSSLLAMDRRHCDLFPGTEITQSYEVNVTTLDQWSSGQALTEPILLKLDVQGYEHHCLLGALGVLLPRVQAIVVEVSFAALYCGQPTVSELTSLINDHGFALSGVLDTLRGPTDGEPLQADFLFVRHGTLPQDIAPV